MNQDQFTEALNDNAPALLDAINSGAIDANTRHDGVPVLSLAIEGNNLEIIRALIAKGADVNAYVAHTAMSRVGLSSPDVRYGMAPIHFVDSAEVVGILAAAGAKVDAPYKSVDHAWGMVGETMLHTKSFGRTGKDAAIAAALVRVGANVDAPFRRTEYAYDKYSPLALSDRIVRSGQSLRARLEAMLPAGSLPKRIDPQSVKLLPSFSEVGISSKEDRGLIAERGVLPKGLEGLKRSIDKIALGFGLDISKPSNQWAADYVVAAKGQQQKTASGPDSGPTLSM